MNVSRETQERLDRYEALLRKWNSAINLVAKSTLPHLRERHFADSLQLVAHIPSEAHHITDIGSGGGFPALPLAMALAERESVPRVTLIESDQRKSAFLRSVIRETGIRAQVIAERIEAAKPQDADVVTARALADLDLLLSFVSRHMKADGRALLQKGRTWQSEVAKAKETWQFEHEAVPSTTEPEAVILIIKGLKRV